MTPRSHSSVNPDHPQHRHSPPPEKSDSTLSPEPSHERICCICLELPTAVASLACKHLLCWSCWSEWSKRSRRCPYCREEIPRSREPLRKRSRRELLAGATDSDEDAEEQPARRRIRQDAEAGGEAPFVGDNLIKVKLRKEFDPQTKRWTLGLQIRKMRSGLFRVISLTESGAACRSGSIKVGDILREINGLSLSGQTINEVMGLLQLLPAMELTIERQEEQQPGAPPG